ncbi:synaptonemal complex protein 1-like isoform X2 [Momordica charantia]|uniref:Synaptonemal complex protein 1-like isoform X2 n=1 Tax=Momordica charantia TaxID=3673 RepID=A0A6J1CHK1_MOMCH|nr:synaptonemal complex protein 1-like isoform X2 [Momordica charantia]
MEKLGFPSMKSLKQLKSLSGSAQGTTKTFSFSSRSVPDSASSGSFVNLKIAAEKLMKEQVSLKTDLEMANTKLRKSVEHVRALEDKLQTALNENAKLKVKQNEDEKLWKGLEFKFSSTKTLCDQLTETLQQLACQVQEGEKDKEVLEAKLSASSIAVDGLNQRLHDLSIKVESAEETIKNREKELAELKIEKEENCKLYRDEQQRTANLIEEKESLTKRFEETVVENRLTVEGLNFKLEATQLESNSKEDKITSLIATRDDLQKEKSDLEMYNDEVIKKLDASLLETKNLENLVHLLVEQLVELDRQNSTFLEKFNQLNLLNDSCFMLVKLERDVASELAEKKCNELRDKLICVTSEKSALKLINVESQQKVDELQKVHESLIAQLSEESRLAGERIQKLASEVEILASEKTETESLVSRLEEKIGTLSESSRSSENKMQDLLQKISALEIENQSNIEKLEKELHDKAEEIGTLMKESENHKKRADMLEIEGDQLHNILKEKEEFILLFNEREKKLEEQNKENQALLLAVETKLSDAKRQYDTMLESKQLELSKHLKEISHRNDQADQVVQEMERNCEQKLAELKEESRQCLIRIQEEHATLLSQIQQEHARNEQIHKGDHNEELKRAQLQAENELKEKLTSLRSEHEAQMKALRHQNEDECRKLQEELDLQKTKEDRQRTLLQLQWKVMGDKLQEDQEVNSKKDYSMSSIKMRGSGGSRKSKRTLIRPAHEEDSPYLQEAQTPVSKLLKTVEDINTGSVASIPKHHKKVTRREYEVETTNGRTITKRRKTKSTVLFEDPRKHSKTPRGNTPRGPVKTIKGGAQSRPSNIGDLFTEGSLNPYADDPYAFD